MLKTIRIFDSSRMINQFQFSQFNKGEIKLIQVKSIKATSVQFSSVAQLCPTLRPHESQHARPPCPSCQLSISINFPKLI